MKNKPVILIGLLFFPGFAALLIAFWLGPVQKSPSEKLSVMVSIAPQAFFVEKIAGDRVSVEVLVPAGKEPENYTPSFEKIKKLTQCSAFFRVGFPPELALLPKLKSAAPNLLIIDTREGLSLEHSDSVGHQHEDGAVCGTDGVDPHIWMSPELVKLQAATILKTLCQLDPENTEFYTANYGKFIVELSTLQSEIHQKLIDFQGKTLYVYHPSYRYFCDEFGLHQRGIEIEGKSPTPQGLADWVKTAKSEKIGAILVQPEFNQSIAEKISQETGTKLLTHSPLEKDYYGNLRELTKILCEMYTEQQ